MSGLGVTCLWLNPIHPSPRRDDGYDVADYYGVQPEMGSLGDFVELVHKANNLGLRIIIDLVINHTSNQHPWFQGSARQRRLAVSRLVRVVARQARPTRSKEWCSLACRTPHGPTTGRRAPGTTTGSTTSSLISTWRITDVRAEINKIIGFWLQLGVAGFRLDAAPFVIELTTPNDPAPRKDFAWLSEFRRRASWRRGDALILAEANVDKDELAEYFGNGDRLPMLFNFMLNGRTFLALARADASPLVHALAQGPTLPPTCQWATFLRNHDEVDLSELTGHERDDTFAAFGPEPAMQLYERGIRRRLAPMLGNDVPGSRWPMPCSSRCPARPSSATATRSAWATTWPYPSGTRSAHRCSGRRPPTVAFLMRPHPLVAPVIDKDPFGFEHVNVQSQQRDQGSLLSWFRRALRTLRECPEFGNGTCHYVDTGVRSVLALIHTLARRRGARAHESAPKACCVDLGPQPEREDGQVREVFADRDYTPPDHELKQLELGPYGYRWIRLRETLARVHDAGEQRSYTTLETFRTGLQQGTHRRSCGTHAFPPPAVGRRLWVESPTRAA